MELYFKAIGIIIALVTALWVLSVIIKDVSIVDIFWGLGFVIINAFYFIQSETHSTRQIIFLILVSLWGLRLTIYLAKRNIGKPEDYRYQQFRKDFGAERYWWVSYFQVFLLQAVLMAMISFPLLGVNISTDNSLNILDYIAIIIWVIGFAFEAGGDYQLSNFKSKAENKGTVLNTGFWKYTRHPNYFGDSAVWWSFGLFTIAAGEYWYAFGALIMTFLIIRVSGVMLLEKSLKESKKEYQDYVRKTSSFIPWPPNK